MPKDMSEVQHSEWRDNYLETKAFRYTTDEFRSLREANFSATVISLVSSILVVITYTYMCFFHRKEANRVSLRCVFLCCLSDIINDIMNLVIIRIRGESSFCKAASILIEFSNVWTASLLTLVGVNLVLVFVIDVKRRDLLERYYYASVLVYSLIAESVDIYVEIVSDKSNVEGYNCWYEVYFADRTFDLFSWMWFYGCIFLVNDIAIFCSNTAMVKLHREKKHLAKKINDIALSTTFSSNADIEDQLNNSIKKKQNAVLSTVVIRCILYPLVPFLVNIFGFIIQLLITSKKNRIPGYALSMLDMIFSNIGGFFVAIIFFTDPAITSVIKSAHAELRKKYVEEYILVSKEDAEKHTKEAIVCNTPNSVVESVPSTDNNNPVFIHSPSPVITTQSISYSGSKADVYNSIYRANRNQEATLYIHQRKKDDLTVPIRQISVQPSELNRKRRSSSYLVGSVSTFVPPDLSRSSQALKLQNSSTTEDVVKETYIPYRFPRLATFAHFVLTLFNEKKRVSTPINEKKIPAKSASTTGVNSYMADEDDEDIVIPYKTDTTDVITPIKEEDYFCNENDNSSTSSPDSNTRYM